MVSVAMCTYNGEKFVREQLLSILNQTVAVDEIVICDDKSGDCTVSELEEMKKNAGAKTDIRIYVNEERAGVTGNFERAFSQCHGDIIFLSDQDDVWAKNKVEKVLSAFEADAQCMLVFTDALLVDSDGNSLGASLWEITRPALKRHYDPLDFAGSRFVTGATVAIKKDLLAYAMPIPECWIHDAWLAINASLYGNIQYINENLICYRQHAHNVIGARKRSLWGQIQHTRAHLRESALFRGVMKRRFRAFLDRNMEALDEREIEYFRQCIDFWEQSEEIADSTFFRGFRVIMRNALNGNYKRFNHGIYGALVDLAIWVLSHKTRSKEAPC